MNRAGTTYSLALPRSIVGRPSAAEKARYDSEVSAWCEGILELRSTLDFPVSSRGWCYVMEHQGLRKGDFDKAQELINLCRKDGRLPLDICAEDGSREFEGSEHLDSDDPEQEAESLVDLVVGYYQDYHPRSFWDDQRYYLQLLVEKVDLKGLFGGICREYRIRYGNAKGWSDLNSRAAMMRRFKAAEERGQIPVLLYCGDHDPAGLLISDALRSNMEDLAVVIGWRPDHLIIDRFGLNRDFIDRYQLTWIDRLVTGSNNDLADPHHRDHRKPYVQSYLAAHGPRKVEANALVVQAEAGRQLLRETIAKYLPPDAPEAYERSLEDAREELRLAVVKRLRELADEAWDDEPSEPHD